MRFLGERRGRDLNPRRTQEPETVFETFTGAPGWQRSLWSCASLCASRVIMPSPFADIRVDVIVRPQALLASRGAVNSTLTAGVNGFEPVPPTQEGPPSCVLVLDEKTASPETAAVSATSQRVPMRGFASRPPKTELPGALVVELRNAGSVRPGWTHGLVRCDFLSE